MAKIIASHEDTETDNRARLLAAHFLFEYEHHVGDDARFHATLNLLHDQDGPDGEAMAELCALTNLPLGEIVDRYGNPDILDQAKAA